MIRPTREAPERILVRAPNWVGDVVMATPALRALSKGYPDARITVEARPFLRDMLDGLPYVDEFLPDRSKGWSGLRERVRAIREGRFDWAVLLPDSPRSALAPFLARVPLRIGYSRDIARRALVNQTLRPALKSGRWWSRSRLVPVSMIERYLVVSRALGCPDDGDTLDVPIPDAAREGLRVRIAEHGVVPTDGLLLAVPGANFGSSKLWPAEHFATACDEIARKRSLVTVIAPGPGEEELAQVIVSSMSTRAVCLSDPPTSLAELSALIELATLVITNDTGPRHIAVALGIPTIVCIGPTDAGHTAHLLERQRVLREEVDCAPCGLKRCPIDHRCLTRLAPERVVAAAEDLLA